MYTHSRVSFFDDFPTLNIANIPGYPSDVRGRMVHGVPLFDGDPNSTINHVEIFNSHTSKEKVIHKEVLMFLLFSSLYGHNSWLQNHEPRSILSVEKFDDVFLRNFQVWPVLSIQEEGFNKNHQDPDNLSDEWEDVSSLGPHDEKKYFENM